MERALCLAQKAAQAGEIPVGAVVVTKDGRLVGEGANASCSHHDPTAHAEIVALRQAGSTLNNYRLNGCLLIVTLEPCAMCAQACVHARVDGVVYGAADNLAGAAGSRADILDMPYQNHAVWHMGGVCSEKCAAVLKDFFRSRRDEN